MTTKINATTSGLIETVDTSGVLEFQTANSSALVIGTDQNANFTGTTAITVPNGTTAQRPTPVNGMMRYNTTLSIFEVYANNTWSAANVTPTPVNTVAPVISGSAIVGQNLTCTTGTWSGSPSAYYYQWRANSTAISNATANVFTLTLAENGANITCNVTAYNVAGNSTPATSNTLGPVIQGVTASYLVVAGGAGGGWNVSGGGGAGGLLANSTIFQPATTYTITVGAGGSAGTSAGDTSTNGANSSISGSGFTTVTAIGGGRSRDGGSGAASAGVSGGSGGGASTSGSSALSGGSGTAGQGNNGGANGGGPNYVPGGGGGAGAAGDGGSGNLGGNGGVGVASSISGSSVYYAGGGGAGAYTGVYSNVYGSGGNGGGGRGGSDSTNATGGSANTGGGGGGGGYPGNGGSGGSGIVIISYAGAQQFGGGVVSSAGGNTIHTFYTSGSLVPLTALSANYLVVAGGGGGGSGANVPSARTGGGGGAGGLLSGSNVTIDSSSTYVITVGSGGAAGASGGGQGANGTYSAFSALANSAVGGGGGGANQAVGSSGGSGGGGGAGGGSTYAGGSGTSGQGYAGGSGATGNGSGGGGGAGQVGFNGNVSGAGGNGGNGTSSSISGVATYYAGGGGGGADANTVSPGGLGGGGAGGTNNGGGTVIAAIAGTANSGGGGGGGGSVNGPTPVGAAGGSGVVIISYPGSTPMMAGGNVTVVSNTVVHTFTSSGFLTPFVNLNNSLRFRSSASAYLSRTPSVTGDRQKFTISTWVKRGVLSSGNPGLFGTYDGGSFQFYFATDSLGIYSQSAGIAIYTNQVFRDPAAWYHFVLAVDTTQATASDRVKLYVNGTQVTSFSSATYPSQNANCEWNRSGQLAVIGAIQNNSGGSIFNYFDGYQTEINNVSGQALGPNYFGAYDQYGTWKPIRYVGSYGLTGFYLNFGNTANTTALGYDSSGNQNNWTTNNFSLTAGPTYDAMVDVPTLTSNTVANYWTLNPLHPASDSVFNGNLSISTSGTGGGWFAIPPNVKFYFEVSYAVNNFYVAFYNYASATNYLILSQGFDNSSYPDAYYYRQTASNGASIDTTNPGGNQLRSGTFGLAVDLIAGYIYIYDDNTLIGTCTLSTTVSSLNYCVIANNTGTVAKSQKDVNFGQQPFVYTPPAGFLPLNTYNM